MISPLAIDHVSLFVRSVVRTQTYYTQLFDVVCQPWVNDATVLLVESPTIHFFLIEAPDLPAIYLAKQHISFEVDDLTHMITKLNGAGITDYTTGQFEAFTHHNYKWCEWRDPDGIRLECVERI
ncbi:MAG: VOC family protein [Chloroflexota bacterium]